MIKGYINRRRERLVKKWGKTVHFTNRSISDTLVLDYLSLTPKDGEWHHMTVTVAAWVKKQPKVKIATVETFVDGETKDKYVLSNLKNKKEKK